jgi:hypothetical protein
MTPIFTTGKLKKMFYLVDTCAKKLTLYVDEKTADGEFRCLFSNGLIVGF